MDMQTKVNRELLKYGVMQTMFCPKCQHVMDVSRAVQVSVAKQTVTACATCFDAKETVFREAAAKHGQAIEILDGRVLFGKARKVVAK